MPPAHPVRRECYPREIPQPGGPKSGLTSSLDRRLSRAGCDFGGRNDDLFFEASSLVTGNINGGGGTNHLTLPGAAGSDDTLRGNIANFSTLTKDGEGKWTVAGNLAGFTATTVKNGTLALTGDNANYSGAVLVEESGILEARAQSLPTKAAAADNVDNVTNNGLVRFTQVDDGTYIGQITGTGAVEKVGAGILTLAPVVVDGNTYSGGTIITEGTVVASADNVLGAATGDITFNGGALRFDNEFDLSSERAVTVDAGGGTIDTQDFTTTISRGSIGTGKLTKIGSGTLDLTGDNAHSGGTTVSEGTLALGDATGAAGALSGGGPVIIASGATLGGYGSITGDVTNNGTLAVANALAAFASGPNANFTINGGLTNSSLVQIGGTDIGNSLTVAGDYVGNSGTVALNTYLGTDGSPSDKLIIDGGEASGTTGLQITNIGGPGAQTLSDGILVIDAVNGGTTASGAFSLAGSVAAGAYDYFLFKGGFSDGAGESWYLRNTIVTPLQVPGEPPAPVPEPAPGTPPLPIATPGNPSPTPPTPGATPVTPILTAVDDTEVLVTPLYRPEVPTYSVLPPVAYDLGLANLGTFHERRGEQALLQGVDFLPVVWGRVFGQDKETKWSGTVAPTFDGHLYGFQAGADLFGWESSSGHRDRAGLFVAHSSMDGDIRGQALGWNDLAVGKLNLDGTSFGAYWTHVGPTGWYLDGVVMGTWFSGDATSDRNVGIDIDGSGVAVSLEGGYPIALTETWTIEPQAQIIYQHLSFDDQQDRFSTVSFDTDNGVTGRLGARLQGEMPFGDMKLQPYLKANLWHDFKSTDTVNFGSDAISTERKGTSLELGGGVVAKLTDTVSLFATADYTTNLGGERNRVFEGNLGLSVKW